MKNFFARIWFWNSERKKRGYLTKTLLLFRTGSWTQGFLLTMGLDAIRKKTRELQAEKKKEQEKTMKAKSMQETWEESAHSTTVPAERNHYASVKRFNPDIYSQKDADELYKYSKFSIKNRGIATPSDVSGKRPVNSQVNLNDREKTMINGTSGQREVAESMNYKHVWVRKKVRS